MPNIAEVLKQEITRLARKEVRQQTKQLRATVTKQRAQIASLNRGVDDLRRDLANAQRTLQRSTPRVVDQTAPLPRYSPARLKSFRSRINLSADAFGKLVGVSGLTIYNWESGKSRPRDANLRAIATIRGIGKREARARLEDNR